MFVTLHGCRHFCECTDPGAAMLVRNRIRVNRRTATLSHKLLDGIPDCLGEVARMRGVVVGKVVRRAAEYKLVAMIPTRVHSP